jgi:hypothetical protein
MTLLEDSTTSLAVKYGDVQLGVFISPRGVLYDATDVCSSSSLDVSVVQNLFSDSWPHY